jgi:hypothetical protein
MNSKNVKKLINEAYQEVLAELSGPDELSIGTVKNIEIFVNDQSSIADTMFYRLVDNNSGKEFEVSVDVAGETVDLNYVKELNPILVKIGFPHGDAIGNYIVKDINKELDDDDDDFDEKENDRKFAEYMAHVKKRGYINPQKKGEINKELDESSILELVDTSLDPLEDKKEIIRQVAKLIKKSMPADNEQIKAFIKTHYNDIINLGDDKAILDEFQEFLSVNYPSASDFTKQERPSGSDLLDLRILIQQVVGVKTIEDALEVIKRYESKDFKGSPVSPEEAKELIAGLRTKEEDKDDRKITNLMAKAFSIKLNESSILNESMLDEEDEEEPTPEEEPDTEAPEETVLEDATDQIIAKFPTLKATIVKLQTEEFKEFVESVDWISPRPTEFRVNLKNGQDYILKWSGKGFEAQILGKRYFLNNISEYQQALDKLALLYKEGPLKGAGDGEAADTDTGGGGGGGGEFPGDDAAGGGEGDIAADDTGEEEGGEDLSGEPVDFEDGAEPEA